MSAIAAARYSAAHWPLSFRLDAATPMNGGKKLSAVARLIITARVSRSGNAMPEAGDLHGGSRPLAAVRSNVQIAVSAVQL